MSNLAHAFLKLLIKNTVGAYKCFLFRVLHNGPRKFKFSTTTSGLDAFRENHGAMPPADLVVVVDCRTHLHVIQSNAPKLIEFGKIWSTAWRSDSERRFYDDHDRNGSTLKLVTLLRPWIRCFTMIIFAKKSQEILPENLETKATPKRVWIRPTHSASAAFS